MIFLLDKLQFTSYSAVTTILLVIVTSNVLPNNTRKMVPITG